jgi:hypothetical protein
MSTRAQLHRRRSHLARAWDLHIPAICDKRPASAAHMGVRTEIAASWERSAAHIMPEVHEAPLADVDETRRAWEESPLSTAVRQLESQLQAAADDGELVVAVTDPAARILWTYGSAVMRRKAEQVNFVPGGRWDEASVGTNALDLALRLDHAATVYSAEHFSSCVHGWVCWAAPVRDPGTGPQLGVLDLSTTWDRSHPIGLATAEALARLLGREVRATTVVAAAAQNGASSCRGLLELKLLGQASAQLNGAQLRLTRRQIEILALLALNPDGLDLAELHARLYGDRPVSQGTLKAEMSQLRALIGTLDRAVVIDVPLEVARARLLARRVCAGCGRIYSVERARGLETWTCGACGGLVRRRSDDTEEAVTRRLTLYDEQTQPLLEWFARREQLLLVDGVGSSEEVFSHLLAGLWPRWDQVRLAAGGPAGRPRADRPRSSGTLVTRRPGGSLAHGDIHLRLLARPGRLRRGHQAQPG